MWLELGLPDATELGGGAWALRASEWFEGSLDAWESMDVPVVDWGPVSPVLHAIGLEAPETPTHHSASFESRLLEALPHLYARGVGWTAHRISADLSAVRLFPTVGFVAKQGNTESPEFWTVRASVGVIRECVITIRLPDLLCAGVAGDPTYRSGMREFELPSRYLPPGPRVTADDFAEAIALHQAATTRAVADRIRGPLREIEQQSLALERRSEARRHEGTPSRKQGVGDDRTETASQALGKVMRMTETVYQLDRQVSRLLRRFGSYGDSDRLIPQDVKLRYTYALDEIHSLADTARLARDAVTRRMSTEEQETREQFHLIAAILASAILIPGLVAAIYGANVELPADNSWPGFFALLLFVLGFAGLGLWAVNRAWSSDWVLWLRSQRGRRVTAVLALLALAAAIAIAVLS
jgi:Mg2+ and Co2+ transporter CorA